MTDLCVLLEQSGVSDYRVITAKTSSYELFFVHRKAETVRATDTTDVAVTVYMQHDGVLGDSTFSVYASDSESDVAGKIAKAKARALLVSNQPYPLPEGGEYHGKTDSPLLTGDPAGIAARVAEAVFAADCYRDGSINALEVFLYRTVRSIRNSRGVFKSDERAHLMLEAIPTWNADGESVELYEAYETSALDPAAITEEIDRKMQQVRDRRTAKKPEAALPTRVVLLRGELEELFFTLAHGLNYGSVYQKANVYSKGDAVQKDRTGDPITLTVKGEVEGSVRSACFDGDGVTLVPRTLIREGTVTDYYGGIRFASYLGETPTGNLPCVEVAPGTLTDAELAAEPYFECVSLSGLQLDPYHDYIGGEVRLGYLCDGGSRTPVTGVTFSGRLSGALAGIRLSAEVATEGGYRGPVRALLSGISSL